MLALSGCEGDGTGEGFSLLQQARNNALTSAEIVPGAVVAQGPRGFCLDQRRLEASRSGGFALLASCAALGKPGQQPSAPNALMTIQALPEQSGGSVGADGLAEAFAAYRPISRETRDGLSLVQLERGGDEVITNGDTKHWRAALNVNGYQVGLTLYSENGGVAATTEGKALIRAFAKRVIAASPSGDVVSGE
ncbi:hypothetical protein DZK27_08910 [Rhodobacteraceae bacterium 63075]|nr:hypothetical protein DZK27_08910 [Rhodobacteraceae bacterium 63075]